MKSPISGDWLALSTPSSRLNWKWAIPHTASSNIFRPQRHCRRCSIRHAGAENAPNFQEARLLQLRQVLSAWESHERTVILDDLNSLPDSDEQAMLRETGLLDAFVLTRDDLEPGYTSPADKPIQRIDYIWLSPDPWACGFQIPESPASDHLGIAVTIGR